VLFVSIFLGISFIYEERVKFMTMVTATWHPESHSLELTGAGHDPILIARADGTIESHAVGGIVILGGIYLATYSRAAPPPAPTADTS
jgi:hypothetical protein